MNKYNEGDKIKATLGTAELTGEVTFLFIPGAATIKDSEMFLRSLEASGWDVVITDPAPLKWAMPTEYGYYLDIDGYIWELSNLWFKRLFDEETAAADSAPFTRLEPVSETAKKVLDRVRTDRSFVPGPYLEAILLVIGKEFGVNE